MMKLFKNLFRSNQIKISSYKEFWDWFVDNEEQFFNVVKSDNDIPGEFLDRLSSKLEDFRSGYFFLTGMYEKNVVELIFTAEGVVKNVVFIEDIVKEAPELKRWKFTALKPALDIRDVKIEMRDIEFSKEKINFYSIDDQCYPDQISIKFTHEDINEDNRNIITSGVYVYLDHLLGEDYFITSIDDVEVVSEDEISDKLIPIEKIANYLIWRQKEFIEKYIGFKHNSENDNYVILEANKESKTRLIATVNSDLLKWDKKASHPWILIFKILYNTEREDNLPSDKTAHLLNEIEDLLLEQLAEIDGYLNIGRETSNRIREIYFACKEFRIVSRKVDKLISKYKGGFTLEYDLYKDKYWKTFEGYKIH